MLDLYKNIKQLRLNRGMTQTELASKTGYSDKGMISRIEKGSIDLPVSKIEAFASALCTDPLHLMGDSWSQLPQPLRTESEDLLLSDFRQLNEDGQAKMLDYATDLLSSGRYKKPDYDELGEGDFETA